MASLGASRSLVPYVVLKCDKVVKRDTSNTSNLRRYLQTNHPPQYKELLKLEEEKQKENEEELVVKIKI
jgi:hypothetical protein